MPRFIALRGVRPPKNVAHLKRLYNVIYGLKPCCKVFILKTNNKPCQIMWKLNTNTSIRNVLVVFPMSRFTRIVAFMNIYSIELCLSLVRKEVIFPNSLQL